MFYCGPSKQIKPLITSVFEGGIYSISFFNSILEILIQDLLFCFYYYYYFDDILFFLLSKKLRTVCLILYGDGWSNLKLRGVSKLYFVFRYKKEYKKTQASRISCLFSVLRESMYFTKNSKLFDT